MPQDLALKIARLIGDYNALLTFVDFLEHELEKRIVARHCLTKLEALDSIAPVYKNELRRRVGPSAVANIEGMLRRLAADVQGGIRSARNAVTGHQLHVNIDEIPDQWRYLGHTTSHVLSQELGDIDSEFSRLDSSYARAPVHQPLPSSWLTAWRAPLSLGPPGAARVAYMPMGKWVPDLVANVPKDHNEASIRVIGACLMLDQLGKLLVPVMESSTVYERLLIELCVIDFFAVEEAALVGNIRGATPSLMNVWQSINHAGATVLGTIQSQLNPARGGWRTDIRNKVCAHIDPDIPAINLDLLRWPWVQNDFFGEVRKLLGIVEAAAKADVRTMLFMTPVMPQPAASIPNHPAPGWIVT